MEIDLGKGLTLRIAGRMDRIDEVSAASFEVRLPRPRIESLRLMTRRELTVPDPLPK